MYVLEQPRLLAAPAAFRRFEWVANRTYHTWLGFFTNLPTTLVLHRSSEFIECIRIYSGLWMPFLDDAPWPWVTKTNNMFLCFSNMKEILHLHLGALRKSEKEKRTKLTTTRSWTILCPLCKCKNIDQLVLQTPSFPWVTLKLAKESTLTPKANNALLEHLVWKLHRFPSWSNVQIHICFYPELVHTMFTSPFILRVYPVGFARSLLNLYEKHVGAKPGRTSRNWRVGPTL